MTKKVISSSLSPAAQYPPLSNPFVNPVSQVVTAILQGSASSPPPQPITEDRVELSSLKGKGELLYFGLGPEGLKHVPTPPPGGSLPADMDKVRELINRAEQEASQGHAAEAFARFFQALHHLNSSILDLRGLLIKAVCLLKTYKFVSDNDRDGEKYINEVDGILNQVEEKLLWESSHHDPSMMYLLGSTHLMAGCYGDPKHYQNARKWFHKVLKLAKDPAVKQKTLFDIGISYFYQVKNEIIRTGTQHNKQLLNFLQESITYLTQAVELKSDPNLKYILAVNHALTFLLLDEVLVEARRADKERIYRELKNHFTQALEILSSTLTSPDISEKLKLYRELRYKDASMNPEVAVLYSALKSANIFDMLALYGSLLYQTNAENVNYGAAYQAFQALSDALLDLTEKDPTLSSGIADCARQLAWGCPIQIHHNHAAQYLDKVVSTMAIDKVLSLSILILYNIQRALAQIMEANQKIVDLTIPASLQKAPFGNKTAQDLAPAAQRRRAVLVALSHEEEFIEKKYAVENLQQLESLKRKIVEDLSMLREKDPLKDALLNDLKALEILRVKTLRHLREKSIDNLKRCLDNLKSMLDKTSKDSYYDHSRQKLTFHYKLLARDFMLLTTACDTREELRDLNSYIQFLGDELNSLHISHLFKNMLIERVALCDLSIDIKLV